jgi:hypothetical protein
VFGKRERMDSVDWSWFENEEEEKIIYYLIRLCKLLSTERGTAGLDGPQALIHWFM